MLGTKDKHMMFLDTVIKYSSYFLFELLLLPYVIFFEMIEYVKVFLNETIDSYPNGLFERLELSIFRCDLENFVKHLKFF